MWLRTKRVCVCVFNLAPNTSRNIKKGIEWHMAKLENHANVKHVLSARQSIIALQTATNNFHSTVNLNEETVAQQQ